MEQPSTLFKSRGYKRKKMQPMEEKIETAPKIKRKCSFLRNKSNILQPDKNKSLHCAAPIMSKQGVGAVYCHFPDYL